MQEFEVVFTDINIEEIRAKLKSLGAKKIFERTYRRLNFEYPDWRLDKNNSWIRLRDEGDKITLAFKKRLGPGEGKNGNDLGMEEIEIEVNDFEKTKQFFLSAGFIIKYDIENKRERWIWGDYQFDLDTYPVIPTILEIESTSWQKVDQAIELLGLDKKRKRVCTAYQICREGGFNPEDYQIIHFDKLVRREQPRHSEI